MAINFGEKKTTELAPAGAHVAVLYSIVQIGTIEGEYMGNPTRKNKIRLTWELSEEKRDFDGVEKPLVVGKTFTASLYEQAKLRPIVEGMTGGLSEDEEESFDIKQLLGKACILQIGHAEYNGRKYADVISAAQLPKGLTAPKQFNDSIYLDHADGWDDTVYEKLPQFMKDKIGESLEGRARFAAKLDGEEVNPNDIPF